MRSKLGMNYVMRKLLGGSISALLCMSLVTNTVSAEVETKTQTGEGISKVQVSYEYYDDVNFVVTLPKNIPLDENGFMNYPVKVEGAISPTRTVTVLPIDKVKSEDGINFMLKNMVVPTAQPVTAQVIQPKTVWSSADVANSVVVTDSAVSASAVTLGNWRGDISFRVSIEGSDSDPLAMVGSIVDGGTYPSGIVVDLPAGSSITLPDSTVVNGIGGSYAIANAGAYSITLSSGETINFTVVSDSAVPISSLVEGGIYDTGLKVAVEGGATLLVDGEEVSATDGAYTFNSEGEYELTYSNGVSLNVVNIQIKHTHVWADGICMKCDGEKSGIGESVGNVVDGGTYSVGTTLQVESGSEVTVNGDVVQAGASGYSTFALRGANVVYTFRETGDYVVKITDAKGTKTANISISDSKILTIDSLVNGATYTAGTEIEIPEGSTITVNGAPVVPVSGKIELGSGESTIVQTDSNGNSTIAVVRTHEHDYNEEVLSATCITEGAIQCVCDCGSEYVRHATIDHDWSGSEESVVCSMCGWEVGTAEELAKYTNTIDAEAKTVTLKGYKGSDKDVTVYGAYMVDGVPYSTYINGGVFVCKTITSVTFQDGVKALDCSSLFDSCESLTSVDLSGLDTSQCTNMSSMFACCRSLTSLNLSGLDTSSVTDMSGMFGDSPFLTSLDLSSFDTSNVTKMNSMFGCCASLTSLDLTSFDTSSVTGMRSMFNGCEALTSLDLTNFDTSSVTDMNMMFNYCIGLTSLDLTSFDTSSVTDMGYMFNTCSKLKTINVSSKWTTAGATTTNMFNKCGTSEVTVVS